MEVTSNTINVDRLKENTKEARVIATPSPDNISISSTLNTPSSNYTVTDAAPKASGISEELQFSQLPNNFSPIIDLFNRKIEQYKKEHEHWKERLWHEIFANEGVNNVSPGIFKMAFRAEYTYNISVALMGENGIFIQLFKEVYGEDFLHSPRGSAEEIEDKYSSLKEKFTSHFSYLSNRKKYLQDKLATCSSEEMEYIEDSLEKVSIEQDLVLPSWYVISGNLKSLSFADEVLGTFSGIFSPL